METENKDFSKPSGATPCEGGNAASAVSFCRSVPPQEAVRVLSVEQDSVTLALPLTSTSAGYKLQIDYSSRSHSGTMVLEDYKIVKVPNLHPEGKYTFFIKRIAEDGRQSIATSLWALTDVGSPKQIRVDHVSHDSLSVCWTPPAGDVKNYTVICLKGKQIVKNLTTTYTNITVAYLEPGTCYILEVSAEYMNGKRSKPAVEQAYTDVGHPGRVAISLISHNSVSLGWTPPAGVVKNYNVTCHKGQQIVKNLTTTVTNITVTDLEPWTCYTLEVSAEYVNGKRSKPAVGQAYTDVDIPKHIGVFHVSDDSLSACWTPPVGDVKTYTVICRIGQQIVRNLSTIYNNITVTDLEPERCYTLEVSAAFVNGKISKPASMQATTNVGSPKQVGVNAISHNSLFVCWTPPAGRVKNYTVICHKGELFVKQSTTTDTKFRVTPLEPGTCYTLKVSAEFVDGKISKPAMTQAYTSRKPISYSSNFY